MATHLRRGSYEGRWEVYVGDLHIGWVVKHHDGLWQGYAARESGVEGRQVGWNLSRRQDAVHEVEVNRTVWPAT